MLHINLILQRLLMKRIDIFYQFIKRHLAGHAAIEQMKISRWFQALEIIDQYA